ncbi:MAG: hypothetical protein OXB88_08685 [Bacteriovoracales bacterium]|nr:hypothetical protein [Bacteriovoracales bacterium]
MTVFRLSLGILVLALGIGGSAHAARSLAVGAARGLAKTMAGQRYLSQMTGKSLEQIGKMGLSARVNALMEATKGDEELVVQLTKTSEQMAAAHDPEALAQKLLAVLRPHRAQGKMGREPLESQTVEVSTEEENAKRMKSIFEELLDQKLIFLDEIEKIVRHLDDGKGIVNLIDVGKMENSIEFKYKMQVRENITNLELNGAFYVPTKHPLTSEPRDINASDISSHRANLTEEARHGPRLERERKLGIVRDRTRRLEMYLASENFDREVLANELRELVAMTRKKESGEHLREQIVNNGNFKLTEGLKTEMQIMYYPQYRSERSQVPDHKALRIAADAIPLESALRLIKEGDFEQEHRAILTWIMRYVLITPRFKNHPELIEAIIEGTVAERKKGDVFGSLNALLCELVSDTLSHRFWWEYPELFVSVIKHVRDDGSYYPFSKLKSIFSDPYWENYPEVAEAFIVRTRSLSALAKIGVTDQKTLRQMARSIISSSYSPERLVRAIIRKGDQLTLREVVQSLPPSHWENSNLIMAIIRKGDQITLRGVVKSLPPSHWEDSDLIGTIIANGDQRTLLEVVQSLPPSHWENSDLIGAIIANGDQRTLREVIQYLPKSHWKEGYRELILKRSNLMTLNYLTDKMPDSKKKDLRLIEILKVIKNTVFWPPWEGFTPQ